MKKLICFIACASGKKEVNEIYKNSILVVLKKLNITPKRVEFVEHNDDIDDKIIELIHKCDFCITDLTYARPSVYFESGYFTGLDKPVIYTSRSDHFFPKEDDIWGNHKIHFDLQMKNIIRWSSTTNVKTFSNKLLKRIKFVTKPLIKYLESENKLQLDRKKFKKKSQTAKIQTINNIIISVIDELRGSRVKYSSALIRRPKFDAFKINDSILIFFTFNSATMDNLTFAEKLRTFSRINSKELSNAKRFNIFITSVRKIPLSRIEDFYPNIELVEEINNTYYGGEYENKDLFYHFISDVKSSMEYQVLLSKTIIEIPNIN